MIHSYADGKIEDTGPLTRKRMETADGEFIAAAQNFIGKAHGDNKPFFVWVIMSHLDWVPTFMAAAGEPDIVGKLKSGTKVGNKTAKLHLDGYNFLPYLTGEQPQGPRREFHYLNDEGMPVGVRVGDWKIVYAENRAQTMALWAEPFITLRLPKIFHLRIRDDFPHSGDSFPPGSLTRTQSISFADGIAWETSRSSA